MTTHTTTPSGDAVPTFAKTSKARAPVQVAAPVARSIGFRKPNRDDYFKISTRPDHEEFRAKLWEHKGFKKNFLIFHDPDVYAKLGTKAVDVVLYVAVNSFGDPFITYRKVSSHATAIQTASIFAEAKTTWVNMVWNSGTSAFDRETANYDIVAEFPDETIDDLVDHCDLRAENLIIEDMNHFAIQNLLTGKV